jgi:hypothetical protein
MGVPTSAARGAESRGEARAIVESAGMSVKRPGLHDKPRLAVKAGLA